MTSYGNICSNLQHFIRRSLSMAVRITFTSPTIPFGTGIFVQPRNSNFKAMRTGIGIVRSKRAFQFFIQKA